MSWRKTGVRVAGWAVQGHICGRAETETQVSVTAKVERSWLHREIHQAHTSNHPGVSLRSQGKTGVLSVGTMLGAMSLDSLILPPG